MLLMISLAVENTRAQTLCSYLFPSNGTMGISSIHAILEIALLVVLSVLSLLGILYAIGYSFNISTLKEFVKKEYIESIFNIILIVLVFGGLSFADGSVAFIANLANSALSTSASPTQISSAYDLFNNLCNTYITKGIGNGLAGIFYLLPTNIVVSTEQTLVINMFEATDSELWPGQFFGLSIKPLAGIYPYAQIIQSEFTIVLDVMFVYIGIAFFLAIIYSLFPILFFLGILLRSFPWSRAAGGALLSLFISFYIIFPSLLFAFANSQIPGFSSPSILNTILTDLGDISSNTISAIWSTTFATNIYDEIYNFANFFAYALLQLIGLIVSLLVSFDLLEGLADLLGAPSLTSKNLLQKVI